MLLNGCNQCNGFSWRGVEKGSRTGDPEPKVQMQPPLQPKRDVWVHGSYPDSPVVAPNI